MTRLIIMKQRPAWLLVLGLASSGCDGSGMTAPWRRSSSADPYVAQRPPFDTEGRKNFYVSGYGGATYGPLDQNWAARRSAAVLGRPSTVVEQGDWPINPE